MAHIATIQFYRGAESGLPTLAAGEPGWTTDTYKLFIGDGATNHEIGAGGSGDVVGPASAVDSNVCLFDTTTGKLIKDGGTLGTAAFDDTGDFDPAGTAASAIGALNIFSTISVSGQSDVVADSNADTLTLIAGSGITITTSAGGDSITIASSALDATLTALAAADWVANALPIGSGADTVSQVSFAANTFPARASTGNLEAKTISDFALTILDDADAAAVRATIGAGTGSGTVTSVGITQPAAGITVSGTPVTTSGNITIALADDLAALEALSGTDTIYRRSGASTWSAVTIGTGLSFSGGTLSATASGLTVQAKSGVFTAAVDYLYLLTTTSGAFTATLPAASGNSGKRIGFQIVSATTGTPAIVTIDANASELIFYDGNTAGSMPIDILGSYIELTCDGSMWYLTRDDRVALFAKITRASSTQTISSSGSWVRVDCDTASQNSNVCDVTTDRKITLKRKGPHTITGTIDANGDLGTANYLRVGIFVNGVVTAASPLVVTGSTYGGATVSTTLDLAVNDYIQLYAISDDSSFSTRNDATSTTPTLTVSGPIK